MCLRTPSELGGGNGLVLRPLPCHLAFTICAQVVFVGTCFCEDN